MQYLRMHNLPARALATGAYLKRKLVELSETFSCIGDIRGRGLMLGMEIVSSRTGDSVLDGALAKRIKRQCFEHGVIVETGGRHSSVMRFMPAWLPCPNWRSMSRFAASSVPWRSASPVKLPRSLCRSTHPSKKGNSKMHFNTCHYARFSVPPLSEEAMREFETLVFDPYTGGKQRYRRFSRYEIWFENSESRRVLPHRPFIQSKSTTA